MPPTSHRALGLSLLLTMLSASAGAQTPSAKSSSITAPARSGALREENITDSEVRELQKIVAERTPGTILQIGPVRVGCVACEATGCTNQVTLIVQRATSSDYVQFARVKGTWQLSEAQSRAQREEQIRLRRLAAINAPIESRKAVLAEIERQSLALQQEELQCLRAERELLPKRSEFAPKPAQSK